MIKFQKTFLLLVLFFSSFNFLSASNAADDKAKIKELIKRSKSYYAKNRQFSFAINYNLFAGNDKKPIDTYSGMFAKRDANYYTRVGDSEIIHIDNLTVKIDHEMKLIQHYEEEVTKDDPIYDLMNYFENFKSFQLKSTPKYWICTFNSREVTFVPYSKIIIYLNKKDYSIVKQELHLLSSIKTKDKKGKDVYKFPILEILFSDFKLGESKVDYFKVSNYLSLKNRRYYPSNKYSSYQLVD